MNIFEISKELELLEKLEIENTIINEQTGEITIKDEEIIEDLKNDIKTNLNEKLIAYRHVILSKEKEQELAVNEIDRLRLFIDKQEKTIVRIKDCLKNLFQELNIRNKDLGQGMNMFLKNYNIYEYNENQIPEKYFNSSVVINLDKNLAKKDFKQGILKNGIIEKKEQILLIK